MKHPGLHHQGVKTQRSGKPGESARVRCLVVNVRRTGIASTIAIKITGKGKCTIKNRGGRGPVSLPAFRGLPDELFS